MTGFIIALFVVGALRTSAFSGGNQGEFGADIFMVVILTIAFNVLF